MKTREKKRKREAQDWTAVRSDKFSRANWKSRSSALVLFVFAVARENRHRVSNRVIPTENGRSAVSLLFLIITGQPIYRGERFARDSQREFPRRHIIRWSARVDWTGIGQVVRYISIWIRVIVLVGWIATKEILS